MTVYFLLDALVKKGDAKGFLREYMRLVVDGQPLPLPSSLDIDSAKEAWGDIVAKHTHVFTGAFLDKLAKEWMQVVQESGGLDDHFAIHVLDVLYTPSLEGSLPQPQPLVNVQQKTDIIRLAKQAIVTNESDAFLTLYLSLSLLDIKPVVPMSTLQHVIELKWEDIMRQEFEVDPSGIFLFKLTTRWFYLMHTQGLPTTLDHFKALYAHQHTHQKNTPVEIEVKKTSSFWKKWF